MYDFDEIIDRRHTNALNTDGFREYIFHADESMTFPWRDEEFIRMWVADMEFAAADEIIDAMRKRLDQRIFGYTKVFEPSFYEALRAWCERRYGWSFPRKELVMANGVIPTLNELTDYILKPGERVLFHAPAYAFFQKAAEASHHEYVCSDLIYENGRYRVDLDDLETKMADPKTRLFILCNPHNPTGHIWTEEEYARMAAMVRRYGVWVISDEIHCDLLRSDAKHTPFGKVLPDYDRLITCMSPSRTFNLAGLMLSCVIIRNDALRQTWLERHYSFDNPLSIAAAQAAYEKGEAWLTALRAYLDENFRFTKAYLAEHLPKAIFEIPDATYLAWVDLGAYFTPEEHLPTFFAYKAGVLLEGGNMFVQHSDCFIRLNLACPRSVLAEGLKRICGAVNAK